MEKRFAFNMEKFSSDATFDDLGMDFIEKVNASLAMEHHLGIRLPTDVDYYESVGELVEACLIAQEEKAARAGTDI